MVKWGSSRGNLQLREQVLQIIIHEVIKKLNKKPYGDEELKKLTHNFSPIFHSHKRGV
jgi:hypothetical protein